MRRLLPLALAAIAMLPFGPSSAVGSTITVGEDDIVSLSGAPEIVSARALVDAAGRPMLALTLRFANSCYADVGARVLFARSTGGGLNALVSQAARQGGCIEIYQPVERRVTALLPSPAGGALRVIGKPAPSSLFRALSFAQGSAGEGAVVEASPIGGGELPEAAGVTIRPLGNGAGYAISASMSVAAGCGSDAFAATVFEVPDESGMPRFDAVAVSALPACIGAGATAEITIEVRTPQPAAGRGVTLLNEAGGAPMAQPR